jgi:hypothetical protein
LRSTVIFLVDPIRRLTLQERQQLRALDIVSAQDLANRVLANEEFVNQFNANLQARILHITAQVLKRRSRPVLENAYRGRAIDVVLVALVLLVAAALWRDYYVPEDPKVLVQRSGGLPPFHVIVPADIRFTRAGDNGPDVLAKFVGHYSTKYLSSGHLIVPKALSAGAQLSSELNDRFIVRLKAQPTNLFSGMAPPFRAALLAAPHDRGASALFVDDVLVLDLQTDGDSLSVVLALPTSDESTLAAFMAHSDFLLVARAP